jgi:RNA polymerase sigma-70 factor (ECF subfamily)
LSTNRAGDPNVTPASLGAGADVGTGDWAASQLELLRSGLRIMALRALHDADAAEDVAQETLARALAVLRAGRRIDPEELGAFVGGIARHVIADRHRAQRREVPLHALPDGPPAVVPDALAALVSADQHARLRKALAGLSAADRELLRLSFFDDLSPSDLARRLGAPAERIRKRKSRALERLRRAFFGTGHDA